MRISDWSSDVCSSDLCRILRKASRSQQKQTLDRIPWYVNRIVPNNCVSHFRWQSDLGLIERHSEQVHSVALRNQYGTGLKPCSRDNDCLACVLIPRLGYKRFNMLCLDLSTSVLDLYENKVAKGADLETTHDIKLATI